MRNKKPEAEADTRTPAEIKRAHDILGAFVTGQVPGTKNLPSEVSEQMSALLGVLCWVLRHENNPSFGNFLASLEEIIRATGGRIVDTDQHPNQHPTVN